MGQLRIVLADAAAEGDHIDAPQHRRHGADALEQPGGEHGDGQLAAGVARGGGLTQLAHVSAELGQPQQAAAVVQGVVQFGRAQALVLQQVQQQPRIHRAAAAAHHQPLQGGESHGGGHAAPLPDRAQRAAGTQMGADQPHPLQLLGILTFFAQQLADGLGHVLVVETVEAVAPQPLLPPGGRHGIGELLDRQGAVKGGVKTGPLAQPRLPGREPCLHPVDHRQGNAVVQRRQWADSLDATAHLGIEAAGPAKPLAAMHHPVGHQSQLALPGGQRCRQPWGQALVDSGVGRQSPRLLVVPQGCDRPGVITGQQGGLDAGAAGVEHQHKVSSHGAAALGLQTRFLVCASVLIGEQHILAGLEIFPDLADFGVSLLLAHFAVAL